MARRCRSTRHPHDTACVRVLRIDGRVNSTHWHFVDALGARQAAARQQSGGDLVNASFRAPMLM